MLRVLFQCSGYMLIRSLDNPDIYTAPGVGKVMFLQRANIQDAFPDRCCSISALFSDFFLYMILIA